MKKQASAYIAVPAAVLFVFLLLQMTVTVYNNSSFRQADAMRRNGPTLVIDPGHGGADGGAVSISGARESEINLAVALRAEQIASFFGAAVVMTRTSEEIQYPDDAVTIREKKVFDQKRRVDIVRTAYDPVLLSIHQNTYQTQQPSGAVALYSSAPGSRELAEYLQSLLVSGLDPQNTRAAALISDKIYLMKNVECPAVLVECGFLSNSREEALLMTDGYRLKLAVVLVGGFLNYRDELSRINSGGTYES